MFRNAHVCPWIPLLALTLATDGFAVLAKLPATLMLDFSSYEFLSWLFPSMIFKGREIEKTLLFPLFVLDN